MRRADVDVAQRGRPPLELTSRYSVTAVTAVTTVTYRPPLELTNRYSVTAVTAVTTVTYRPPLELTNREFSRYPLTLDLNSFRERLASRHAAQLPPTAIAIAKAAGGLLRTHTPYLRLALNRSSELRRAPEVGQPSRGWLLLSAAQVTVVQLSCNGRVMVV